MLPDASVASGAGVEEVKDKYSLSPAATDTILVSIPSVSVPAICTCNRVTSCIGPTHFISRIILHLLTPGNTMSLTLRSLTLLGLAKRINADKGSYNAGLDRPIGQSVYSSVESDAGNCVAVTQLKKGSPVITVPHVIAYSPLALTSSLVVLVLLIVPVGMGDLTIWRSSSKLNSRLLYHVSNVILL